MNDSTSTSTDEQGNEQPSAPTAEGASADAAPEAQLDTSIAPKSAVATPEGHTDVDVPQHIADQLPPNTAVSQSPAGHLVASVPTTDGVKHIAGHSNHLHHLVETVRQYFFGQ